jgi:hypothetical protein
MITPDKGGDEDDAPCAGFFAVPAKAGPDKLTDRPRELLSLVFPQGSSFPITALTLLTL